MRESPSWQIRVANKLVELLVRRESWGDERALVRRARRLFGAPRIWSLFKSAGLEIEHVDENGVRGEWTRGTRSGVGTIFYIHGGGYVSCSPVTHRPITTALARLSGRDVFSLDYRLAPEHRFPAALDDALAAYRWLVDARRADPATIAVAGDSAGGGLALALLVALRDEGIPLPASAILGSPWTDLTGSGKSARDNDGRCHMFRYANLRDFASLYIGSATADDPRASPLFADLSELPPILLQVGSTELLLDDARRVHEKIVACRGDGTLEVFPDAFHGWQMLDGIVPESREALKNAVAFILSRELISGSQQSTIP